MRAAFALVFALGACTSSPPPPYGELVVQTIAAGSLAPLQGVRVQVDDLSWATTNADGKATFRNVHRPYSVRTDFTYRESPPIVDVRQIPDLDVNPVVLVLDTLLYNRTHSARMTGSVARASGAPGSLLRVVAVRTPMGSAFTHATNADGTFDVSASWVGPDPQTVVLHAFESDAADPPTHYTGHGSLNLPVSDPTYGGVTVSGLSLELGPVTEMRISGTVSMDPAIVSGNPDSSLVLALPDTSSLQLSRGFSPLLKLPASFDYAVPIVGAPTAVLSFQVSGEGRQGQVQAAEQQRLGIAGSAPMSGLSFHLPAPASLVEPPDGAAIGPGTTFRWEVGPSGGHYELFVGCNLMDPVLKYYTLMLGWNIVTTSTQAQLFTTPSFSVKSGMTCSWGVDWYDRDIPSLVSGPLDWTQPLRWSASAVRSAVVQ